MSPRTSVSLEKRKRYNTKKSFVFAENLRALRTEQGMRMEDLASKAGITKGFISLYEAGVFPSSAERLVALADALGVSTDALLRPRAKE